MTTAYPVYCNQVANLVMLLNTTNRESPAFNPTGAGFSLVELASNLDALMDEMRGEEHSN